MAANGHRPRVLIPEKVSPEGLALLQESFDVDQESGLTAEQLLERIGDYEALVIRSETKVTAQVLQAAKKLKVVARAGVGVDNVDVAAATNLGVIVVNSPSGNIVAAAEHTIALLLATARNIPSGHSSLKAGQWSRGKLVGVEVSGKTLGIIGLGKVGLKVARMAVGLGMKVLALDPYASPEIARAANVSLTDSLGSLLPSVDFLTIHTPLIASTMDLISTEEFSMMKPTARVLNVARGGVYNEASLLSALDSGTIAGAGLDVFTSEPPLPSSAAYMLTQHPKVVATPHLGASTVEAQENVSIDVCAQVATILRGGLPTSAVNAPLILPEEYRKLQPFVGLVERIGGLYTQHYSGASTSASGSRGAGAAAAPAGSHAPPGGSAGGARVFDLIYEGELATITNTRPLFAALIKGLTSSISESGGRDVNIVNATLIAKSKGLVVHESHRHDVPGATYASLVTLRARTAASSSSSSSREGPGEGETEQLISGYVSGNQVYISRLDRFATNFVPEGTLLILRNYDSPGKIGHVGSILGKRGVNIRFMSVASLRDGGAGNGGGAKEHEALMILGVEGVVDKNVVGELRGAEGILDVSVVRL
jgi:D-3-phosphoglycerate dehydrogenase